VEHFQGVIPCLLPLRGELSIVFPMVVGHLTRDSRVPRCQFWRMAHRKR
jgi:hypothetical protein